MDFIQLTVIYKKTPIATKLCVKKVLNFFNLVFLVGFQFSFFIEKEDRSVTI